MDVVTLVIAVVGLALSLLNIAWNVRAWLYERARLSVEAARAIRLGENEPYGEMLSITARNLGRGSTSLTGWGLQLPGGEQMPGHAVRLSVNRPVPYTLEGQHSQTWYLIPKEIDRVLVKKGYRGSVRLVPFVAMGSGKQVQAEPIEWTLDAV